MTFKSKLLALSASALIALTSSAFAEDWKPDGQLVLVQVALQTPWAAYSVK